MKNIKIHILVLTILSIVLFAGNALALDWTYQYDPYNDASGGAKYEVYRMGYAFDGENLYVNMLTGLPQEGAHSGDYNYVLTEQTFDKLRQKAISEDVISQITSLQGIVYPAKWDLENALRSELGKWVTDGIYSTVKSYGYHYTLTDTSLAELENAGLATDILDVLETLKSQVWESKSSFETAVKAAVKAALGRYPTSGERKKISAAAEYFTLTDSTFAKLRAKGISEEFVAELEPIKDQIWGNKNDFETAVKATLTNYTKSGVKGTVAQYAQKEATMINAGDLLINVGGSHNDGYVLDAEGNPQYASGDVFGLALNTHEGDMNYDMLHTSSSYSSAGKDDEYDWTKVESGHLYSDAFFSTGVYEAYKGAKGDVDGGKDAFGDENNAPVHIAEFGADLGFQGEVRWEKLAGYTVVDENGTKKKNVYEVNAVISLEALGLKGGETFEIWWAMECGNDFISISGVAPTFPVPEPGTIILLGLGILGLSGIRQKRRS